MKNAKSTLFGCLILGLILGLGGCGKKDQAESKVYQGACLELAADAKTLTLANSEPKLNPIKGASATFDLSKAKVGLMPDKGDVIRVAYFKEKDRLMAIKVMNVTKQDLRKK